MLKVRFFIGFAVAALALGACVGGGKGLSSEDKEKLKAYILDSEPADMPHKLDINFENKVHIVGYKVDPEMAKPGTDMKVTYYWRCDDTLDDGWALFTHVTDESQSKSDNLDWSGPIRENRDNKQLLGPSKWERGKYYVDEQSYKVPDWVKGPELTFYVGVWKANARLHVVAGPNDGDNRGIVVKAKTGLQPPPPPQHTEVFPEATAGKLAKNDKITIDGKGDEAAWKGAAVLGPFVDVGTGGPNTAFPANGKARVLFDDQNLYAFVEVTEEDVVGGWDPKTKKAPAADDKKDSEWTTSGQPKLWTKDAVELMIDPGAEGDNKTYYEIQISPQNQQFHAQFDELNTPKTEPNGPFGHEDWEAKIKSAVSVHGTIDDAKDKDTGYDVELAIPWTSFAKSGKKLPPELGDVWRMNFYAMKKNAGVAWSPILGQGNFHKASRFGKVHWGGAPIPPPVVAASGAPDPAQQPPVGQPPFRGRMRVPPGAMAVPNTAVPNP